jgi:hypothetical protein
MQTEIVGLVISFGKAARLDLRGRVPNSPSPGTSNSWEATLRPRSAYFEDTFGFDVKTGLRLRTG